MPRRHTQVASTSSRTAAAAEAAQIVIYTLWTAPVVFVAQAGPARADLVARIAELRASFQPDQSRERLFNVPITADVLTSPVGG